MDTEARKKFLEARKTCIGGSDISGVLGTPPYGCPRRVYYSKIDAPRDYDDSNRKEFRRGWRLEPVACEYYEDETKRLTRLVAQRKHKTYPNVAVNADRLVWRDFRVLDTGYREGVGDPGYLEIKTTSSCYPTKRSGVWDGYIQQVQYGMAILGLSWGSFAIYAPNDDELLYFDFSADESLGKILTRTAQEFWDRYVAVRLAPPRLPEGSKPCVDCVFKSHCQKPTLEF